MRPLYVPSIVRLPLSASPRLRPRIYAVYGLRLSARCASPHGRRLEGWRGPWPSHFPLRRAAIVFIAFANPAFLACAPPLASPALIFLGVALPKEPTVPRAFIDARAFARNFSATLEVNHGCRSMSRAFTDSNLVCDYGDLDDLGVRALQEPFLETSRSAVVKWA